MKTKKLKKKLNLKKQTISSLSRGNMQDQRGGASETCLMVCSVETYCVTECRPSICVKPCM